MLATANITMQFGSKPLFENISVKFGDGNRYGLIGANGCGKSTFLKSIVDLKSENASDIYWNDISLQQLNESQLAKQVAIVTTKPTLFGNHKSIDVIKLGRIAHASWFQSFDDNHEIIHQVVQQLEINDLLEKEFNLLSDGEKQLIMIARAMVQHVHDGFVAGTCGRSLPYQGIAFLSRTRRYQICLSRCARANQLWTGQGTLEGL